MKKTLLSDTLQSTEPYGSIADNKVNPDLEEERQKKDFDDVELTKLIYGYSHDYLRSIIKAFEDNPTLQIGPKLYEMSRQEIIEHSIKHYINARNSKIFEID